MKIIAFAVWALMGVAFIVLGIYERNAKGTAVFGFWSNVKPLAMKDIKGYNAALGKLWIIFGIVFILLGIPLLPGQNSALIIISIVGIVFESIAAMAVYTIKIEKKYRK